MKLKVGDVVEFKNYEDMSIYDTALLTEDDFPESGKVTDVRLLDKGIEYFRIEGSPYNFNSGSVARVISDVDCVDINSLNPGDEVLMKVKIGEIKGEHIWVSWVDKTDVVKILKRKEPEHFIVQDDNYGMYIIGEDTLSYDKSRAKIYTSRSTANEDAVKMGLNEWKVIPYDNKGEK